MYSPIAIQQYSRGSREEITLNQALVGYQPPGIPVFLVEIKNQCSSNCTVGSITSTVPHLAPTFPQARKIQRRFATTTAWCTQAHLSLLVWSLSSTPPPPCTPSPSRILGSFAINLYRFSVVWVQYIYGGISVGRDFQVPLHLQRTILLGFLRN